MHNILSDYTKHELFVAWQSIYNRELQEVLFAEESLLLVFLSDSSLQEELAIFIENHIIEFNEWEESYV